jgi:putative addiction module killer protein
MIELRQTFTFKKWLDGLSDRRAQERIAQRLLRIQSGLLGDVKPVGNGVSEARIDHGPGYRLYFVRRGDTVIVLLCGGDKRSQNRDIAKAHALANDPENE